jgi:hypothetical protein
VPTGRSIGDDALAAAVDAARGYPFLLQLLGQHSWRIDRTAAEITRAHVREAMSRARADMGRLVHDIALDEVSDVDRAYLAAMALDAGRSSTRQIADRLAVSPDYANVYRRRLIEAELIEAELIEERGRGYVGYTLPYFTDHMRTRPEFDAILASNPRLTAQELPAVAGAGLLLDAGSGRRRVDPDRPPARGPGPRRGRRTASLRTRDDARPGARTAGQHQEGIPGLAADRTVKQTSFGRGTDPGLHRHTSTSMAQACLSVPEARIRPSPYWTETADQHRRTET